MNRNQMEIGMYCRCNKAVAAVGDLPPQHVFFGWPDGLGLVRVWPSPVSDLIVVVVGFDLWCPSRVAGAVIDYSWSCCMALYTTSRIDVVTRILMWFTRQITTLKVDAVVVDDGASLSGVPLLVVRLLDAISSRGCFLAIRTERDDAIL